MNISELGVSLIKHFEIFVAYVYDDQDKHWPRKRLVSWSDCRGTATYGYGTVYERGLPLPMASDITEPEAEALLRKNLRNYVAGVTRACKRTPTQSQFDALCSFAYNEGLGALFSCGIVAAFNRGEEDPAAYAPLFEQWCKWTINGQLVVNDGLKARRAKEWLLFTSGMGTSPVRELEDIQRAAANALDIGMAFAQQHIDDPSEPNS